MLIIPRSRNQSIVIADNILVNVVEIDDDEVQLSIEYPEGVTVQKGELVAAMRQAIEEPQALQ